MISFISYSFNPYLELDFQNDAGKWEFSAFCLDFEKHIFCLAMVNHEHIAQVYFFWQILEDFFSAELYVKLSVFLIWILKNLKTHKHIAQVKGKDYACAIYSAELYATERNWFISVSTFDFRFDEKFVFLCWLTRSWFYAFSYEFVLKQ